jgi:hypothetical protein
VIGEIDGFQERIQVCRRPVLAGGRNQHEGKRGARQAPLQGVGESPSLDRNHALLHGTSQVRDAVDQWADDRMSRIIRQIGEQDDSNARVREWIAPDVLGKGVVAGLVRGHSSSHRDRRIK